MVRRLDAIHAGHVEIHEDDIWRHLDDFVETVVAVPGKRDAETDALQESADRHPEIALVVHHEHER